MSKIYIETPRYPTVNLLGISYLSKSIFVTDIGVFICSVVIYIGGAIFRVVIYKSGAIFRFAICIGGAIFRGVICVTPQVLEMHTYVMYLRFP